MWIAGNPFNGLKAQMAQAMRKGNYRLMDRHSTLDLAAILQRSLTSVILGLQMHLVADHRLSIVDSVDEWPKLVGCPTDQRGTQITRSGRSHHTR